MTNFPVLKTPGPLADGAMRITPLGGLGEVGRNMTVFELDDKLLIVDCGVLFPEEDQPGVDLILPDFSSIADRLDDVVASYRRLAAATTDRCESTGRLTDEQARRLREILAPEQLEG